MSFLSKTFSPVNTTIFFITLISFIVSLILFFELILADYPEKVILDKTKVIAMYAKENNTFNVVLNEHINNINISEESAIQDKNLRTIHNNKSIMTNGVIPFLLCIVLLFVGYIAYMLVLKYKFKQNLNFEKSDSILIILAISCFVVEIVFYLIVVHNWKFIPDNEVLKILLS